jgi:hypothetical protein
MFSFYRNESLNLQCFDECPSECFNIFYSFEQSQGNYPSPFYAKQLATKSRNTKRVQNLTLDEMRQRVLAVNVYFSDLVFQNIVEKPARSIEQLIADVGGFIGLCVGTSLLSCVEILEIILDLAFTYISFKKVNAVN